VSAALGLRCIRGYSLAIDYVGGVCVACIGNMIFAGEYLGTDGFARNLCVDCRIEEDS